MGKIEKIKWTVGLMLIATGLIFGINAWLKLSEDNFVKLIGGAIIVVPTLLSVIISNKTNNQLVSITNDVKEVKGQVWNLSRNIKEIEQKQHIIDKEITNISEMFTHKKDIIKLSKEIDKQTSDLLDAPSSIVPKILKNFLVNLNTEISLIVTTQYEHGFESFSQPFYKKKIYNKLFQLIEHYNEINNNEKLINTIKDNISIYIDNLDFIHTTENGVRRKEFEIKTLDFARKLVEHSIKLY